MNRVLVLALVASAAVGGYFLANPPVELQPGSPGVQQTGNVNVSGTMLAGTVSATNGGATSSAVQGTASSATGANFGGLFKSASVIGTGVRGVATATSGAANGGTFQSAGPNGAGVRGYATATTGVNYGVYGQAASPTGFGVFSQGNMGASGIISGNGSGLTAVDADKLDGHDSTDFLKSVPNPLSLSGTAALLPIIKGINDSNSTASTGVMGQANGTAGRGVYGYATSGTGINYGGYFDSKSTSGIGVFARSVGNYAIRAQSISAAAVSYGLYATTDSGNGRAVYGEGTDTVAASYGGYFVTRGSGYGAFAVASKTSGVNVGFQAESYGSMGAGVQGFALHPTGNVTGVVGGSESNQGTGVAGYAYSDAGTTYGVYGLANPSGWGIYAAGRSGASGTKSFRIDHPFNPQNEYLLHYSAEGPEPLNVYTGNVTTDANGEAWVQLPDYFAEINRDARYTLTVVDDTDSDQFVTAKVAKKIKDNKFKIRTNAPRVEVSWRVEGIRNDLWVRKYGAPVEVQKEGREKGTYQHPELYGKARNSGPDVPKPRSR